MTTFIDLSHDFEDGMPGFRMTNEDGSQTAYSATIRPFLTHEQTLPNYDGLSSFEITEMTFQTSIGTYLDSPYHRFPTKRDISQIALKEVILEGVVIDVRGLSSFEPIGFDNLTEDYKLKNKAVLFNFGWDKHWGTEQYYSYPFISTELIYQLIEREVKLVGVDTINIDDSRDLSRPAHTMLLVKDILIVENLTNLESLYDKEFRFFSVPIKGKKVAAMPIRAFAEIVS
ncbi:MAG: cyclase family protein [Candidatus Hodarchaeales archaeon]|jgi:kynurenine formamidase